MSSRTLNEALVYKLPSTLERDEQRINDTGTAFALEGLSQASCLKKCGSSSSNKTAALVTRPFSAPALQTACRPRVKKNTVNTTSNISGQSRAVVVSQISYVREARRFFLALEEIPTDSAKDSRKD